MNESTKPPKPSAGDDAHALVRSALGAIPQVGTAAVELFNIVITPPIVRRRDEWCEMMGRRLEELEERRQVTIEQLQQDDAFQTAILQASHMAIRTHSAEKREALCNAVLNTALRTESNETHHQIFLGLVDAFTPTHLKLLSIMDNPRKHFEELKIDVASITETEKFARHHLLMQALLPDFWEEGEVYLKMCNDFHAAEFIRRNQVDFERFEALEGQLSDLGKRFMRFVLTPPQSD